jgi:hypothetical protein
MKNTKRTLGPITRALRPRMGGSSSTALDHLSLDLKSDESLAHFDRAALAALSVGLFVLGYDELGDAGLEELTDMLYGKDSDDSARVFNAIVGAGDAANNTMVNAQRARRRPAFAKAAEVNA